MWLAYNECVSTAIERLGVQVMQLILPHVSLCFMKLLNLNHTEQCSHTCPVHLAGLVNKPALDTVSVHSIAVVQHTWHQQAPEQVPGRIERVNVSAFEQEPF